MKFADGSLMILHVGKWNSGKIDIAANKIGICYPNLYIIQWDVSTLHPLYTGPGTVQCTERWLENLSAFKLNIFRRDMSAAGTACRRGYKLIYR